MPRAKGFWVARTEDLHAKDEGLIPDLAIVSVSPDGPDHGQIAISSGPFDDVDSAAVGARSRQGATPVWGSVVGEGVGGLSEELGALLRGEGRLAETLVQPLVG